MSRVQTQAQHDKRHGEFQRAKARLLKLFTAAKDDKLSQFMDAMGECAAGIKAGLAFHDRAHAPGDIESNYTREVVLTFKDGRQRSLLHFAAQGNATDVIRYVFDTVMVGASDSEIAEALNAVDDEHATPLLLAVETAAEEAAQVLVSLGCAVDVPDSRGNCAIHKAAGEGLSGDFITSLAKAKADVNASSPTGSPLHWACGGGHLGSADALLAQSADPNARDRDTVTPLILATATGSAAIVESLLSAKADVTALTSAERGTTGPLFICSEVFNAAVFDKFVTKLSPEVLHAAANQKNGEDLYPVDCAAFYNEWRMVEKLLPLTDELKDTPLEDIRATAIKRRAEYEAQHEGAQEAARQRREDAKKAALKAKAEGNTHFVAKRFAEAVACYDTAIAHAEVGEDKDTLSILYSNRAAALLGQADVLAAQLRDRADKDSVDFTHGQQKVILFRRAAASDADRSTQIAEKWVKGYLRLGQCQLELHNYADSAAAYWRAGELVKDGDFKRKYHKKFKHAVQMGKDQNAARVRLLKRQIVLSDAGAVGTGAPRRATSGKSRGKKKKGKGSKSKKKKKSGNNPGAAAASPAAESSGDEGEDAVEKEPVVVSPKPSSDTVLVWRREHPSGEGPGPRSSHGVSVVGSTLYVFGGEHEPRTPVDSKVYACDLEAQPSKRWEIVHLVRGDAAVPPSRIGHAQASTEDCFYVFGGRCGKTMDDQPLNDLWCFNPAEREWTQLEADGAPEPRSYHQMTAVGNELFVFGGCGAGGRLSDLYSYDTAEAKWTKLPPPSYAEEAAIEGRGGAFLTASGDGRTLFVIGGFAGREMADAHAFDLETRQWWSAPATSCLPPGFRARSVGMAAALPSTNRIVMYGGEVEEAAKGHEGAGVYAGESVLLDTGKAGATDDTPSSLVGPVANVRPHELFPVPVNRGWGACAVRTVPAVSAADDVVAFGHLDHHHHDEESKDEGAGNDDKPTGTRDQLWVYGGISGIDGERVPLDDLWVCDFVVV